MSKLKEFVKPFRKLKKRVSISFSGGKSSAYMLGLLLSSLEDHEVVVTFANTGREHPATLDFVDKCARHYKCDVVWLEAVTHMGRKGCTHRVVDYDTASRKGEPFREAALKYGVPNQTFKWCNRELKVNTMQSYLRSIGWRRGTYSTAVGIRSDEIDRMSLGGLKSGIFYPLIDSGVTKIDVHDYWKEQPFNLNIPEHYGNCVGCFKKSLRKLLTIAKDDPSNFNFEKALGAECGLKGAIRNGVERKIYRGNLTAEELIELSKKPFVPYSDDRFIPFDEDLDIGGGCGGTCETFADED